VDAAKPSELDLTRAKLRRMRRELHQLGRAHQRLSYAFRDQVKAEKRAHEWRMQYQTAYYDLLKKTEWRRWLADILKPAAKPETKGEIA
jgi:hypothetical protein